MNILCDYTEYKSGLEAIKVSEQNSKKNIIAALLKVQGEIANPLNTAVNPFFKSKYAPLPEILNEIRPLLNENGLIFIQNTGAIEDKIYVETVLYHTSGESYSTDKLCLRPDKNTPQGAGSAITYARRYQLTALLGITNEDDDDGNAAEPVKGSKKVTSRPPKSNKPKPRPPKKETDKKPPAKGKAKPSPKSSPKSAKKPTKKPASSKEEIKDITPPLEDEVPTKGLEKACKKYPLMRNIKKAFNLDGTLFTEENIRNELIDDERCPPEKVDEIMNMIMEA